MVTQVVMNDRLAWLGLAVLVALSVGTAERKRVVQIKGDAWQFGQQVGADGELVASSDATKDEAPVLRIVRVDQQRVVEDVRFAYPKNERITGLDVAAGRVIARLDRAQAVAVYERGTAWSKTDTIKLKGNCLRGEVGVKLAKDVLVVPGDKAVCIYEKGKGWAQTGALPPTSNPNFAFTNGDRVVQLKPGRSYGSLVVSRKQGKTWGVERELPLAEGRHVITAAVSKRWLAVSTRSVSWTDHTVEIYELDQAITHVATLRFADSVDQLAISDTRIVASGQQEHRVFAFDEAWKPAGTLPHTDSDHVAIAKLLWVGRSGVVEGYSD